VAQRVASTRAVAPRCTKLSENGGARYEQNTHGSNFVIVWNHPNRIRSRRGNIGSGTRASLDESELRSASRIMTNMYTTYPHSLRNIEYLLRKTERPRAPGAGRPGGAGDARLEATGMQDHRCGGTGASPLESRWRLCFGAKHLLQSSTLRHDPGVSRNLRRARPRARPPPPEPLPRPLEPPPL